MSRHAKRRLAITVAVILVVLIGSKLWYSSALKAAGGGEQSVEIAEGQTPQQIGQTLQEKKLIKSARAFNWHVKSNDLGSKLQAGRYRLSGERSSQELAAQLAEGPKQASQFTIKEGVTQEQIAEQLGKDGTVNQSEFKKLKAADFPEYEFLKGLPADASLEGFLFPETYALPDPGTSTQDVARIMLDQFGKELTPELRAQITKSGRTVYQTVIVASLVEEEVKTEEDRQLVAGIIYSRLEQNISLGIDATTRYALDKPTQPLTQSDLDSDNPYNTRKRKGLPPGPIANPGIQSIEAAINPTGSDYLFYLTGKDGKTYYAKTNDEHEQNKSDHL